MSAGLPQPLVDLAQVKGVSTDYWDWQGRHTHIPEDALRDVLTALGEDVSTDEGVARSLHDALTQPWRRTLPPTVVTRQPYAYRLHVHVPHGVAVTVAAHLEDGGEVSLVQLDHVVEPRDVDGVLVGEAAFEIPADLPLGWHELVATVDEPDDSRASAVVIPGSRRSVLVVAPHRLELPEWLADGSGSGIMTQLYQVRSQQSWGIGDLCVLGDIARWAAGERGDDFVLVNPLHAAEPVPPIEPSPYLPSSRRFINPLYIDMATLPGADLLGGAARGAIADLAGRAARLNASDTLERDESWTLKRQALRRAFADLGPHQAGEMESFFEAEGEGLLRFATWCAIAEEHGTSWETDWPDGLRDPASEAVTAYQREHAGEVSFYCWLQWVLQEQLAAVQQRALEEGMRLGVVHDLAVGIHPHGADAWALQPALAHGVSVGAPPDQFNQRGQNWSQPPWRPDRLAELGYAPYRDMIRSVLRDSGGIRIDHIIGLFRLWWIPTGRPADQGAYVRYDHEALIGILALEAHRAGALVIGEDLGVVEPWVRTYLEERGVLGTSVVWFEWDDEGRPLAPSSYRRLCLATVTTHDLPPTAGYLALAHVDLREQLGLLTRPVEEERAAEHATLARVTDALVEAGCVQPGERDSVDAVNAGLHRWLETTPSVLRGVALTDVVGDVRTINQPGTDEEYPNWRLPLADGDGTSVLVEDLPQAT